MRRYLLYFLIPISILLGSAALLSFVFEPIEGDLTRIGSYSEMDFGWNAPQPVIKVDGNGKSIADPDVLVLGDSFSILNYWQSALAGKLNKKILSFNFDQIACINNWVEYALNQQSAKIIAIETVERSFVDHFLDLPLCKANDPSPFEAAETVTSARRAKWPPDFHIKQTFHVAMNTLKMDFNSHATFRGSAINAPIKAGCAKFSNRRADRILYYPDDENKSGWGRDQEDQAIENVLQLQMRFAEHGKKLVFIVVPDKLSVYRNCLPDDSGIAPMAQVNITNLLIEKGVNTPDLLSEFKEQANRIVDLYSPNNTHLSISGYILMAKNLERFF